MPSLVQALPPPMLGAGMRTRPVAVSMRTPGLSGPFDQITACDPSGDTSGGVFSSGFVGNATKVPSGWITPSRVGPEAWRAVARDPPTLASQPFGVAA